MRAYFTLLCLVLGLLSPPVSAVAAVPVTEQRYLSGAGPGTAVPWEFRVSDGRRAGAWSTIPVPSNWEQHGFGGYDYGEGAKRHNEQGQYRLKFAVPPAWRGRTIRLVFEGVMTEATVRVNGVAAGPAHTGGFYRFSYDITALVTMSGGADNLLEVDVNKVATDAASEKAERRGDYWVFGGIFRPVWLEAAPAQAIAGVAIDARADGTLAAQVTLSQAAPGATVQAQVLDAQGRAVGRPFSAILPDDGGAAQPVALRDTIATPQLWSAETPHLYTLRLTLRRAGQALHTLSTQFGFRTFEVRAGDGLYLNGRKIIIKGVNRHSFRPATARALDPADSEADARLIKSMNMNTARMSHYPPDPAFLQAADRLGLYVIDELSGWQAAHGTAIGRQLVGEMVPRDVNHPSVLFWANGNEGGFNLDLDDDFARYDPQRRPVLHPWALFSGVDTKHYPNWQLLTERLRGPHLFMPTEFMHALYDGGGGAGLDDYWRAMMASKVGAGGVIWALADEGVARTDQGNRIDPYGTYGPDGIVGPHHEKEGSYFAVRQIWSPVQLDPATLNQAFDGKLAVHNGYDIVSLDRVRFQWQLLRFATPEAASTSARVLASGTAATRGVAARSSGTLDLHLPARWRAAQPDALAVTAVDADGRPLWTWTYPVPDLAARLASRNHPSTQAQLAPTVVTAGGAADGRADGTSDGTADGTIILAAGPVRATFDAATGQLRALQYGDRVAALANGPRLAYARPLQPDDTAWLPFVDHAGSDDAAHGIRRLAAAQPASVVDIVTAPARDSAYARFKLEISADGATWKAVFDATRRTSDGTAYRFPPQPVLAVRVSTPVDQHGEPVALTSVRLGHAAQRFPAPDGAATVESGTGTDADGRPIAWVAARHSAGLDRLRWTLNASGDLRLDYTYRLDGAVQYHGITFDHPETALRGTRWLGEGPYRVWKNRLQGTWLGVHALAQFDQQPGESFRYPESQGYFAGVRWARFDTATGILQVTPGQSDGYLRVGTPRISHANTTVEFPAGDLSWLHAIPAIGEKFTPTEALGPASAWPVAAGEYTGSLTWRFTPATDGVKVSSGGPSRR
jgi:hypothetical protein